MAVTISGTGRIVKAPELKEFGEGKQFAKVTVAVNHYKKINEDDAYPPSDFYSLAVWGVRANWLVNDAEVGESLYFTGTLEKNEDFLNVNVSDFVVIPKRNKAEQQAKIDAASFLREVGATNAELDAEELPF